MRQNFKSPKQSTATRKAALYSSLSILACVATLPAAAQSADAPNPGASQAAAQGIEEIIVTAQKVRSNLQLTPEAISTLNGATLDKSNVTNLDTLNGQLPGLIVNNVGAGYPMEVSIRGIGFAGFSNNSAQPGVSINENGVYLASTLALNADYLDIDQLELLRGPQGTVLGENSDGGAINLTTVQPVLSTFSGGGELSYGSYNLLRARAEVNVPVGDTFALRFAIQQFQHDGWSKATDIAGNSNFPLSNADAETGRITALWKPTDDLTIEAWGEIFRSHANAAAQKNVFDPNPNPRELTQDFPSTQPLGNDILALQIGYDFEWATLKYISSYQKSDQLNGSVDIDELNFATALALYGEHDRQPVNFTTSRAITQEVDLASAPGGPLDWIVGAFFLRQKTTEGFDEYQQSQPNLPAPASLNFTPSDLGMLYGDGFSYEEHGTQIHQSQSIYGQGTYHITDQLSFVGGVRVTHDTNVAGDSVDFAPAVYPSTGFDIATGKAALQFAITPANITYVTWSSGVKGAGTNLNPSSAVIPDIFKPETVNAFELGSKNELFDRTIRVNVSAFYNLIDNYQVDSEDVLPFQGGITNVRKAHTYGLEAEMDALLPDDFRLDGNIALLQGQVDSNDALLDPVVAQQINRLSYVYSPQDLAARAAAFEDLSGKTLPNTPPFSGAIALSHELDLENIGTFTSRVQFLVRSSYEARIFNNPSTDTVPWLRQWNLFFSYEPPESRWYAQFEVINLTNGYSVATRNSDNFGSGEVTNSYIPPRQFIVRVGTSF